MKKAASALRAAESDEEARRDAARLLGSMTSEAKKASSRENGKLAPPGPGRTPRPLADYPCNCGAGNALEGHRWDCPRGQVIKRRQKAGTL